MQLNRRLNMVDAERSKDHLAAAESMLDALQADIQKTPGAALWMGAALRERGLIRDDEGRSEEAIPLYERAVAIFRSLQLTSGPPFLGLTLANLASAHADCGDFAGALTISSEAMSELRAGAPEFSVALYAHGMALHGLGRHTEALRDLREALSIWDRSAQPDRAQVALIKDSVAACLRDLGFSGKAEAAELESLALRTQTFGPDSLGVAESLNNLGVMMAREKRYTESEQSFEKAELILERIGEPGSRHLIAVMRNLGVAYMQDAPRDPQLYAKAERAFRRTLAIEEQLFGSGDIRLSTTLEMLGEALYGERSYNDAGQTYGRAVALQVAAFGPSDPRTQAAVKRQTVLAKKMSRVASRN